MNPIIKKHGNPFSEQGVSKYPPVTPLVGQSEVYQRLVDLLEAMSEETGSCFRAIYGDWGIGKTRLAHEFVAEVCELSRGWVVKIPGEKIERKSLLKPLSQGGVLPVFTTFAEILSTPDEGIEMQTALPKAVGVALAGLAQASGRDYQVRMANDLQTQIRQINPDFDFEELNYIARDQNLSLIARANNAFDYLKTGTLRDGQPFIQKLLVIIDEIETAGEFTPANTAEERRVQEFPVEALDIKTLFSAIKEEAGQATLPHISFLLLCSPGVKRVSYIEASARRIKEATLEKGNGNDLKIFIKSLQDDGYITDYPGELPQAAFLAADRNFGWFSYIMHPVHRLAQEGKLEGPDYSILREVSSRIGKVFKPQLIDGLNVESDIKDYLGRIVYHQIPSTIEKLEIPSKVRKNLLEYIDPYGLRIVGEVYEVGIDGDTLIRELLDTGIYRDESAISTRLIGEGSAPFDPRDLLTRFSTYESSDPGTLFVFSGPGEFANQVRFLVTEDLSEKTIGTLHKIFEKYRLTEAPILLAPTVAFLLKFNERWASVGVRAWLSDQIWEKLEKQIKELSNTQVRHQICIGIAKVLNEGNLRNEPLNHVVSPHYTWKVSDSDAFNLTRESMLAVIYAAEVTAFVKDLAEINKNPIPVLAIFPNEDRLNDWRSELATTHRKELGRLVTPRVVSVGSREHEYLLRYSFRDEEDGFPAGEVRERGREQRREYEEEWMKSLNSWLSQLDEDGYLIRPVIPQGGKYTDLRKAYGLLSRGFTKEQIAVKENGNTLNQAIDNAIMNMANGTVKIFSDNSGALYFPNIFSRILDLLTNPMSAEHLANRLFYQRISRGGFKSPKSATTVIEQILGLLEELGLAENKNGQFVAVDEQRLGNLLTKSINQLGSFGSSPSNYVKVVRELTDPFKQLAFKLKINEDQLKLLANELQNAKDRLPDLDLNSQKHVPARQEAFTNVGGVANEFRRSVDKVYRESELTPLEIDPQTVRQNIIQMAQDNDYDTFSVEQRVHFLKELHREIENERQSRLQDIESLRANLKGVLSKNHDGSAFPVQAMEIILDMAERDLKGEDLTLPETLRTEELDASLRTYMMAGEMDRGFLRLYQYRTWLSQDDIYSYVNRFARTHNQWQDTITATNTLKDTWSTASKYFDGDPDRQQWFTEDLESRCQGIFERVNQFSSDFQTEYTTPKLEDLEAEVDATKDQVVNLTVEVNEAIQGGRNEIQENINRTAYPAIRRLTERLTQPIRVDQQIIWNEKRHIDQHNKIEELDQLSFMRGTELLDDENLFRKYLEIFQDYQSGKDAQSIYKEYGEDILKILDDKQALEIEMTLTF